MDKRRGVSGSSSGEDFEDNDLEAFDLNTVPTDISEVDNEEDENLSHISSLDNNGNHSNADKSSSKVRSATKHSASSMPRDASRGASTTPRKWKNKNVGDKKQANLKQVRIVTLKAVGNSIDKDIQRERAASFNGKKPPGLLAASFGNMSISSLRSGSRKKISENVVLNNTISKTTIPKNPRNIRKSKSSKSAKSLTSQSNSEVEDHDHDDNELLSRSHDDIPISVGNIQNGTKWMRINDNSIKGSTATAPRRGSMIQMFNKGLHAIEPTKTLMKRNQSKKTSSLFPSEEMAKVNIGKDKSDEPNASPFVTHYIPESQVFKSRRRKVDNANGSSSGDIPGSMRGRMSFSRLGAAGTQTLLKRIRNTRLVTNTLNNNIFQNQRRKVHQELKFTQMMFDKESKPGSPTNKTNTKNVIPAVKTTTIAIKKDKFHDLSLKERIAQATKGDLFPFTEEVGPAAVKKLNDLIRTGHIVHVDQKDVQQVNSQNAYEENLAKQKLAMFLRSFLMPLLQKFVSGDILETKQIETFIFDDYLVKNNSGESSPADIFIGLLLVLIKKHDMEKCLRSIEGIMKFLSVSVIMFSVEEMRNKLNLKMEHLTKDVKDGWRIDIKFVDDDHIELRHFRREAVINNLFKHVEAQTENNHWEIEYEIILALKLSQSTVVLEDVKMNLLKLEMDELMDEEKKNDLLEIFKGGNTTIY